MSSLSSVQTLPPPTPLKVAFFGTDEFSLASLKGLYSHMKASDQIRSIDLITRTPKRVGRGRSQVKDTVAAEFAARSGVDVLRAENDSEIINLAQNDYDLAIAVSYGKMIPGAFLQKVKFGGLNVHPSLLPSLRGAAPIHHALLRKHEFTGVSIQTIHPTQFDRGRVIFQTSQIPIGRQDTINSLASKLASIGADSLLYVIKNRLFELKEYADAPNIAAYKQSYAPKLSSTCKQVDFSKDNLESILLKYRALGSVHVFQNIYCTKKKDRKNKLTQNRRIILNHIKDAKEVFPCLDGHTRNLSLAEYTFCEHDGKEYALIKVQGGAIACDAMLLEGYEEQPIDRYKISCSKRGVYCNQLLIEPPK
ncbi:methionyl-tRNA formyltransferase, mitochondrial [Trichomonascus vanleenenianus]|uniref:methionyl-tRNA formyltransferase n=1 Tax=Trichomonascus vanleenenianus TaxID=2268995 RepID=UPI003ECB250D